MHYEFTFNGFLYSNDKDKLQTKVIHTYLSRESYWSPGIPIELVETGIKHSDCFGIYKDNIQIGFARVISDHASFAYLCDVFVLSDYRGAGLSKKLMEFILAYPPYKKLRRVLLRTKDAHGLYSQFGFAAISDPERLMEFKPLQN